MVGDRDSAVGRSPSRKVATIRPNNMLETPARTTSTRYCAPNRGPDPDAEKCARGPRPQPPKKTAIFGLRGGRCECPPRMPSMGNVMVIVVMIVRVVILMMIVGSDA